jgi:hypothetical protein
LLEVKRRAKTQYEIVRGLAFRVRWNVQFGKSGFSKDVFRDVALIFMHQAQGLRGHEEKCDADRASPRINVGRSEMV